jgi:chloramphenicol O-acetyltransferase
VAHESEKRDREYIFSRLPTFFFSRFPDEIENSRTTSQPKKKEKKRKEKKGRVPPMLVTVSLLTRLDM